jgi:site-specific DNA-methyltransferase (adenine-specific)
MTSANPNLLEVTDSANGRCVQRFVGRHGVATLYNADCREMLSEIEADFIVTDPPYGIKYDASGKKYLRGIEHKEADWDKEPYDPTPIIALKKPTIMWGGNCFASRLPDNAGWLCWLKTGMSVRLRQAEMELAWTNCVRRPQTLQHIWIGNLKDSEWGERNVHPTQKPVRVMAWCLEVAKVPIGATVLDPYMGSGTTGIACLRTGRNFIGVERDAAHYKTACDRIAHELDGALL